MPRVNAVSFHEDPSIESICKRVQRCGFDSLELSRPPFFNQLTTEAQRRSFSEWVNEIGLNLYGFDCWVDVDPYEAPLETLAGFQEAVEFATQLNLGMIITHDPWASVNQDRSPSACMETCLELFSRVAELCRAADLRLVFEPHPDTLSMNNEWATEFIDRLTPDAPPQSVGLVYDCCHYGVGQPSDYLATIDALGERIQHVHFSDGDAKTYALHLPLGEGVLDLEAIVEALQCARFAGTLTNDLYNCPSLDEGAGRSAQALAHYETALELISP